jgi:uncharacterized membrane protein (DUF4010 family)
MLELASPIKLLLSLLIGAAIGLERESYEHFKNSDFSKREKDKQGSLGVRTFSLITTLGTLAGLLRPDFPDLFITINIVFLVLLVAYYITGSILIKDNGITTEMAVIFSYLIGVFIALNIFPIQLILAIAVILILVLSQKEIVRQWIAGIKQAELTAFISYAIIALVVLPFLPNIFYRLSDLPGLASVLQSYGINNSQILNIELVNPYKLWFIVAIITGLDIFGYLLSRTVGQKKGYLLTSFVGGFVSSTSTTISLAQKSRKSPATNKLVAAAIVANLASFFQLFALIASTNGAFLVKSSRLLLILIVSTVITAFYFIKQNGKSRENLDETKDGLRQTQILSLAPAIRFALIYLSVGVAAKLALTFFGEGGFYLTSAIAALTGIDAVILNLSAIVGTTLSFRVGVLTIILVNAVNLISKCVYSYLQGKREFAIRFSAAILVIIVSSLFALWP